MDWQAKSSFEAIVIDSTNSFVDVRLVSSLSPELLHAICTSRGCMYLSQVVMQKMQNVISMNSYLKNFLMAALGWTKEFD